MCAHVVNVAQWGCPSNTRAHAVGCRVFPGPPPTFASSGGAWGWDHAASTAGSSSCALIWASHGGSGSTASHGNSRCSSTQVCPPQSRDPPTAPCTEPGLSVASRQSGPPSALPPRCTHAAPCVHKAAKDMGVNAHCAGNAVDHRVACLSGLSPVPSELAEPVATRTVPARSRGCWRGPTGRPLEGHTSRWLTGASTAGTASARPAGGPPPRPLVAEGQPPFAIPSPPTRWSVAGFPSPPQRGPVAG